MEEGKNIEVEANDTELLADVLQTPNAEKPAKPPFFIRKFRYFLLVYELIAVIFWTYAFLNVLVLDIDAYLVSLDYTPLTFLVTYKFFVLIGCFASAWILLGNLAILAFLLYVLFYPLILPLWRIPKLLWKAKSPLFTLAFLNIVIASFRSVKYIFITSTVLLIFSAIIILVSNTVLLYLSSLVLLILLVVIYINRFLVILKPSVIYQAYAKIVKSLLSHGRASFSLAEEIKNRPLEALSKSQRDTRISNIQSLVIGNRAALFLSSKLSEYQKSNVRIIFYVGNLFILILITTFIFAVMGLGLYKANPSNFQVSADPNLFMFVYYSVSNIFTRSISEIVPNTDIGRTFSIVQSIFSFVLLAVIFTLFLSHRNQSDSQQIDNAIKEIREQGVLMEEFIQSEFKLTAAEAILELEKTKAFLIKFIYYLTRGIPPLEH